MTNVVMPQMGESIAEGTIVRWIKKVGDTVDRDEPLFEISTDKVDAEIPSPAAGVLTEIKVNEGGTVPVNSVIAVIGEAGSAAPAKPKPPAPTGPSHAAAPTVVAISDAPQKRPSPAPPPSPPSQPAAAASQENGQRQRSSPLVRRIAREHNIDVSAIQGSGLGGRVTKNDILGHVKNQKATPAASTIRRQTSSSRSRSEARSSASTAWPTFTLPLRMHRLTERFRIRPTSCG